MRTLTLRIFDNRCARCGTRFRTRHLAPEDYGLVLFASSLNDLVYVDADEDPVWEELKELLPEAVPEIVETTRELDAFEAALGATISGATPEAAEYVPVRRIPCPGCGSLERGFWGPMDPPASERAEVPAADHGRWQSLSRDEKKRAASAAARRASGGPV